MSWLDDLSPSERQDWDSFADRTVKMIASSAFVASLVPDGEPDVKFAAELGFSIMLGKPVIAIATHGREVPAGLRRVAHAVIEVGDTDTEAGQLELHRKLQPYLDELAT